MAKGLRSNSDALTTRQISQPATGPAPDSSAPTGTVPLANVTNADDLKAIEALAATAGLLAKTAANTWALRTLTGPAAGITVGNGDGAAGNPTLALANDLAALEAMASTGIIARTAAETYAQRTIELHAALATILSLTNPAGVAGNPLFDLANQDANEVLAGPASGSPAKPTFRALTLADLAALDYDEATSFTPTITFATPGDLSVAYTTQLGVYWKIGRLVAFVAQVGFTPTYTTAAGNFRIASLPFASDSTITWPLIVDFITSSVTWPAGTTHLLANVEAGASTAVLIGEGSGAARAGFTVTQFPTATARSVKIAGFYFTP